MNRKEFVIIAVASHLKNAVMRAMNTAIIGTINLSIAYLDCIIGKPITEMVRKALVSRKNRYSRPIKIIIFLDKPRELDLFTSIRDLWIFSKRSFTDFSSTF